MTKQGVYPEVLCIRVPKGTEKRIRALCRKLKLRRADFLRVVVESGLQEWATAALPAAKNPSFYVGDPISFPTTTGGGTNA